MDRSVLHHGHVGSLAAAALLTLAACGGSSSSPAPAPPVPSPTLTVTPPSGTVQAGEAVLPLAATLANSSESIAWTVVPTGIGSISATGGAAVTYTPPVVLTAETSVTVTASAAGLSRSVAITVTPSVVVTLAAAPRTASTADLTFGAAYTTPASFGVWRSTTAGDLGVEVVKNLPAATSTWRDTGLTGGTTYQYTVVGSTAGGGTYRSAQIQVMTAAPAAFPAPPAGLTATFVPGDGRHTLDAYTLEWDPYPGATYYIVQSTPVAELVGNGALSALEGVPTVPTLAGRSVTAGTTGYFWVEAYDTVGKRLSAPAMVRVDDGGLPGQQLFVAAPVLDVDASALDLDRLHLYFYGSPGAAAHHVYVGTDPSVLQPHAVPTPALDGPPTSLPMVTVKPG